MILTFGEASDLLKEIQAQHGGKTPEALEIIDYVFNEGYTAALKDYCPDALKTDLVFRNPAAIARAKANGYRICPKCGERYTDRPAISRADNKTEICPDCGQREAIEAYENYLKKERG